jgi:hypothetical protein
MRGSLLNRSKLQDCGHSAAGTPPEGTASLWWLKVRTCFEHDPLGVSRLGVWTWWQWIEACKHDSQRVWGLGVLVRSFGFSSVAYVLSSICTPDEHDMFIRIGTANRCGCLVYGGVSGIKKMKTTLLHNPLHTTHTPTYYTHTLIFAAYKTSNTMSVGLCNGPQIQKSKKKCSKLRLH